MKKSKIAKDLPLPKKLTKEDVERIDEEARRNVEAIKNPPMPDRRVKGRTCAFCQSTLEKNWHKSSDGILGGKAYWKWDTMLCPQCRLVYI